MAGSTWIDVPAAGSYFTGQFFDPGDLLDAGLTLLWRTARWCGRKRQVGSSRDGERSAGCLLYHMIGGRDGLIQLEFAVQQAHRTRAMGLGQRDRRADL